mgnify:CR=1 FL=1
MWLTGILIGLLLVVIAFLFVPIVLFIDTQTEQYYVRLGALAKASVEADETEIVLIKLKIAFLRFTFYPLRVKEKPKDKMSKVKRSPRKRGMKGYKAIRMGTRVMRTFTVKRLLVDIDTGDCISNAKLYPVAALLNYKIGGFHVNFEGRNRLALHLQNRPIYMIRSFINN